ncbi:flavin-containing monooxygenase [Rhodococcus sp. NPDC059968]|uniref:flavin-containing monooxygenase n=1 Tax=Rhodococcus sp. NPDC059968 TaxID=3347017 RepID=UPI00366C80BB
MNHETAHDTMVVIVGTGFSGLALATRLKRKGITDFVILERADGVGGTWRDNTYPGAACDIQSHLYSYSFRPNPRWSQVYAQQPEILCYLQDTARDEGLLEHIRFDTELLSATWSDDNQRWHIVTSSGAYKAKILVTASGHLSDPKSPDIAGLEQFGGARFHSAKWDHDVELKGKRVGVIGTGASAIQVVPELVGQVENLIVFQRSAPYIIPRRGYKYSEIEKETFRKCPEVAQALRDELFWGNESRFPQRRRVTSFIEEIRRTAIDHLHGQVSDPQLRAQLTPDYEIGCKRILISNDYYPALGSDNATLETSGIREIVADGAITADGRMIPLDALVLCSGFEASDLPIAYRITGRNDMLLADRWSTGGQAFACAAVHGFPNMFVMLGPNTGLGAGSIIYMVEAQANYILEAVEFLASHHAVADVTEEAETAYVRSIEARSNGTVWTTGGCASWYVDARSGRLTTLWPDFMSEFRAENGTFVPDVYRVSVADSATSVGL